MSLHRTLRGQGLQLETKSHRPDGQGGQGREEVP